MPVPVGAPATVASMSQRLARILLAIYAVAALVLTIGPSEIPSRAADATAREMTKAVQNASPDTSADGHGARPTHHPRTIRFATAEDLLNVALFVPFGFLLPIVYRRLDGPVIVLAGAACSTLIELSQLLVFTWRSAQVRDVVTNTLGTALGFAVLAVWRWSGRPIEPHRPKATTWRL